MNAARAHREGLPTVYLVSSSGGHLALLRTLLPVLEDYPRVWVTQRSPHAEDLMAHGELVHLLPEYDRHPIRGHFAQNLMRSISLVQQADPEIVITTGSGIAVPFCTFARMAGARMIFVETMARVTGPSASGRVLSRLADRVIVQWPELMRVYRRTTLCHPALLEMVEPGVTDSGRGTFVAVGLHAQPFDRLLRLVAAAASEGVLPEPVTVQAGNATLRSSDFEARPWMTPEEVDEAVASARVVISHAGAGIVSTALRYGRRPLVLPRLARYGEHYDDHQEQLVAKLAELDLVVSLCSGLGEAEVRQADRPLPEIDTGQTLSVGEALERELEGLVQTVRGWRPRRDERGMQPAGATVASESAASETPRVGADR
jgi:UDP-N-acetylglucosamine transferase subunit ALG13